MKTLFFATTNKWKIKVAKQIIEKQYGIVIQPITLDVVEIQNDDPIVIARESVKDAYRQLGAPVIKCDSGLSIPGLGGFPGPYSNYIQRTLGVDGLLQLCHRLTDRTASIYSIARMNALSALAAGLQFAALC